MKNRDAFANLAGVVADLAREMPREMRYQRLLGAFRASFPCDAIALLALEGDRLVPRAVQGLSPDTRGRQFTVADHPRLARILASREPVRFPADSELPDPYDGLVDGGAESPHVHDCMGAPLHVDGQPWGVVTLDALTPGTFDAIDPETLAAFVAVASATVRAADWIHRLEEQLERHHQVHRSLATDGVPEELIGESPAMVALRREARAVAPSELPVLVLGETGVGKELVARLVHRHSARAAEPMVHVNCAALPEAIAESELFGHARGAFSGAVEERAGKFELAHEGTLLLDEVGELSLPVQAKLLRALETGEIQRIGSDRQHRVSVRLIAATNRDLKAEVAAGRFRADLFHRLSVYPLVVPPLRERGDDRLLLAGYFLERCRRQLGLRGLRLDRSAREWLAAYDWPGNVRELSHAISRGAIKALSGNLGSGGGTDQIVVLGARHLGAEDGAGNGATATPASDTEVKAAADATLADAVDTFKRELVRERLRRHRNNLAAAARSLGMDRGNFHRLLRRLNLR